MVFPGMYLQKYFDCGLLAVGTTRSSKNKFKDESVSLIINLFTPHLFNLKRLKQNKY